MSIDGEAGPGNLHPGTYSLVTEKATARFALRGLAGTIKLEMPVIEGTIVVDRSGLVSAVRAVLDTAGAEGSSLVVDQAKGKSGFDAERHPTISFASTQVMQSDGEGRFEMRGKLTIKGVTRDAIFAGEILSAKERRITVLMTGEVDRTAYGVTVGRPLYGKKAKVTVRGPAVRPRG